MMLQVKLEFGLTGWESGRIDRLTGSYEWRFEIGRSAAVKNLNLGLLNSPEGQYFLAGLWDADGGWTLPDESHPLGQARIWGGWHTVYRVKHVIWHRWGIKTGRMSIATHAGHTSKIGDYTIVTRKNVYGTGVLAKSMKRWIELVGTKMMLKSQLPDGTPPG